jgi:hypothetical protein
VIINLTPHAVNVIGKDGNIITSIPPTGKVARVRTVAIKTGTIEVDGHAIDVVSTSYGEVEDLPDSSPGIAYIVSALVLQVLRGSRNDVICPDTGPESVVRDAKGGILGVKRFIK